MAVLFGAATQADLYRPLAPPAEQAAPSLLGRLHVGLLFAVSGVPVIAFGVRRVRRHNTALRAEKRRRADQLRRLDDSRAHYLGPREPYPGKTSDVRRVA